MSREVSLRQLSVRVLNVRSRFLRGPGRLAPRRHIERGFLHMPGIFPHLSRPFLLPGSALAHLLWRSSLGHAAIMTYKAGRSLAALKIFPASIVSGIALP